MPFAVALALFGIGLTIYQIATRNDAAPAPVPPDVARAPVTPAQRQQLQQRASACGLLPGDWRDAERWVEKYLGPTVNLLDGLKIMQSTVHASQWPMSARRVHCTYLGGAIPVAVGQQIRDAVFPRYGG